MKSISVLLVALLVSVSAFAFSKGQSPAAVQAEVRQLAAANAAKGMTPEESAQAIAFAALQAGVPSNVLAAVMGAQFGGIGVAAVSSAQAQIIPTAVGNPQQALEQTQVQPQQIQQQQIQFISNNPAAPSSASTRTSASPI